jgi:hypothetical protein
MSRLSKLVIGVGFSIIALILGFLIFTATPYFGYAWQRVDANEVGVRLLNGVYQETIGPGVWSDWNFFADLTNVKIEGMDFNASDPEVLTSDLQRLGVTVSGTVFRPGVGTMTTQLWSQYRQLYLNDTALFDRMTSITQQAMKVCVGERTFQEAAVGENRNGLTVCIDEQLSLLAAPFGLDVQNVVVPNVTISAAVQESLDQLTASRNATLLAEQETLRIEAETQRDLTAQEGLIQIEQGRVQEDLRQRAISADLEQQALQAEQAVISQQNANNLLQVQGDLAVAEQQTLVAEQNALASTAEERATAALLTANPAYASLLYYQQLAVAVEGANMIIVPAGTNPFLMFGQDGLIQPTIDVSDQTVQPEEGTTP